MKNMQKKPNFWRLNLKSDNVEWFARVFGFISLNFDINSYSVRDYSFGADSNSVKFHARFFGIYHPDGVTVTDITNDLVMKNGQTIN